ncbi:MAG: PEGA domain-containing protein [Fibrobacteria bacterium]|nr:PEGA domain-containing protein [Fibrobacteria bacterium]
MKNFSFLWIAIVFTGLFIFGQGLLVAQDSDEMDEAASENVEEAVVDESAPIEVPERGGTGSVTIITQPPKAHVYLDGEDLGFSPIENKSFRSGRFDLTIMLQGEDLVNERLNVWPGKLTTVDKDLKLPYGSIILETKPGHTKVFIDEEDVGRTEGGPLTINNVKAGSHIIKVKAGRRSKTVEVEVLPEDTTKIKVSL